MEAERRFHAVRSRRRGVRLPSLKKRSMETRAMYVDDDNEASIAFPTLLLT
jgi:hypothetical protein